MSANNTRRQAKQDRLEEIKYEGAPPQPDLLSYKGMQLVMLLRAATENGWFSVAAVIFLTLCGIFTCSALFNLFQ